MHLELPLRKATTTMVASLICLASIFLSTRLTAANFPLDWQWCNPLPHGNNIIDVAYANGAWIVVAERGRIYTSSDLLAWTAQPSHTTRALRAVTFFKNLAVIVGESGTVLTGPSASALTLRDQLTTDWLEGVAASPQTVVAVGDNAAIYTSADGELWQRRNPRFNDWLRSIAYGAPGGTGLFVAVGEAGFVTTSADGATWQTQPPLTAENLNRVAWFGGEFWILGDAGVAFKSASGTKWSAVATGATNVLNAFAGQGTTRLIAGASEFRLKVDNSGWSNELNPANPSPPPAWTYLSATPSTNNTFLVCGRTGMTVEGQVLSGNVASWYALSESPRNWLWDVKRFPSVYLAVGDRANILSSTAGLVWELELPPQSTFDSVFLGIGGKTNLAVAVGSAGTIVTSRDEPQTVVSTNANGTLVTNQVSTLGILWEAVDPRPTTQDLQGVAVFNDQFVLCGGAGTVLTSPDARVWSAQTAPTSAFLSSLAAFPGGLVAVGHSGTLLTSPDASTWTARAAPTTDWIYRVRYTGGRLIAVGQNGLILTSPDGVDWTRQQSGTTAWLNDVQFVGDTFFVVGTQGTVLSSPDAVQWTERGSITGKSLFGAARSGGQLVTVGVEGIILRSEIGLPDTPVSFVNYPRRTEETAFQFAGQPGQKFTLDRSTNLTSWATGPLLELDPAGTLNYQDALPNSPRQQFFRTMVKP